MHLLFRIAAPLLMGLTLASCGGGGGSSDTATAPSNPAGAWLTFSPNPVNLTGYEGESVPFQITATSSRTFAKPFNVAVIDSAGVVTTDVKLAALSDLKYQVSLTTSSKLAAGSHQTSLEVRLCEDEAMACRVPLPGSPWRVPVNVTVKAPTEAAKRLTLSTPSPTLTAYPGEPGSIDIEARIGENLVGQAYQIGIVDPAGLATSSVSNITGQGFKVTLKSVAGLLQGEYSGKVELRLCRDDPRVCNTPVVGSPWTVPLTVSVKSAGQSPSLTPVAGVGAWSTYQGNAGHTGYIAASFDAAKFKPRWNIAGKSESTKDFNMAASDNGLVYIVLYHIDNGYELVAISEANGTEVWRTAMSGVSRVNPPAAGNGHVYVTSIGTPNTSFWIFDQRDGELLNKTSMIPQWGSYMAPTVVGTDIYTESGGYGSMSKFSALSKSQTWRVSMPQYDSWTPAVDARYAYVYMGDKLLAVDINNGTTQWSVSTPESTWSGSNAATVTLSGNQAFVSDSNRLMAFDINNRTRTWVFKSSIDGQPAYGNDTLYVLNAYGTVLEARSPANGGVLWTSELLSNKRFSQVIVTRNLAFIGSATHTLAIDLATHKIVWSHPVGGDLSISGNGILYIFSNTGSLSAINLQ